MRNACARAVVFTAVVVSLAACGSSSTSQQEQDRRAEEYARSFGIDADVKTNPDGSKAVTVNQGFGGLSSQSGTNVSLPEGFPEDVPVYPQANLYSASQMPGLGFMVQGRSSEAVDKVSAFYKSEMTGRGWTEDGSQQTPAMHMAQYKKGERTASVTLLPDGDGTTIQLTVMASGQ